MLDGNLGNVLFGWLFVCILVAAFIQGLKKRD